MATKELVITLSGEDADIETIMDAAIAIHNTSDLDKLGTKEEKTAVIVKTILIRLGGVLKQQEAQIKIKEDVDKEVSELDAAVTASSLVK